MLGMSDNADDALPEFKEGFRNTCCASRIGMLGCRHRASEASAEVYSVQASVFGLLQSTFCGGSLGPGAVSFVGNLILRQQPLLEPHSCKRGVLECCCHMGFDVSYAQKPLGPQEKLEQIYVLVLGITSKTKKSI
jgi:hypothetical protein